jgi:hypothetical protein
VHSGIPYFGQGALQPSARQTGVPLGEAFNAPSAGAGMQHSGPSYLVGVPGVAPDGRMAGAAMFGGFFGNQLGM